MSLFHLLFGFSGRINRGKYWLAVVLWLVFWVIALPVCLLAGFAILGTNLVDGELPSGSDWLEKFVHMTLDYVVLFIIFLTLVSVSWISAFAIGIKRLHDRNKNGWFLFCFMSRRPFSRVSRTHPSRPWSRSCSGSPLSASRSGAWWSLASCAVLSAPTRMGLIHCKRPPPLPLLPHPPVPEIGIARGWARCPRHETVLTRPPAARDLA